MYPIFHNYLRTDQGSRRRDHLQRAIERIEAAKPFLALKYLGRAE